MEDDLNFLANGRRPQFFGKWKTTSIFWEMEDNLSFLEIGRQTNFFRGKIEDDLNFKVNGRRPQVKLA